MTGSLTHWRKIIICKKTWCHTSVSSSNQGSWEQTATRSLIDRIRTNSYLLHSLRVSNSCHLVKWTSHSMKSAPCFIAEMYPGSLCSGSKAGWPLPKSVTKYQSEFEHLCPMMVNGLATVAKKIRKLETITGAACWAKTDFLSQADVKK